MSSHPPAVRVRRAALSDAPALAGLLRSLGWFEPLEQASPDEAVARVGRMLERGLSDASHSIYVATDAEDRVVGYASVHWLPYLFLDGPEGFVSELFLAEDARGRRIGTALLNTVEDEARALGCARLQLVNFRSRESYQRRFYEKAGFTERPDGADFVKRIDAAARS